MEQNNPHYSYNYVFLKYNFQDLQLCLRKFPFKSPTVTDSLKSALISALNLPVNCPIELGTLINSIETNFFIAGESSKRHGGSYQQCTLASRVEENLVSDLSDEGVEMLGQDLEVCDIKSSWEQNLEEAHKSRILVENVL